MGTTDAKAKALAEKITATASAGLNGLEITLMKWPAEFRAIMWDAVVEIARQRANEARNQL